MDKINVQKLQKLLDYLDDDLELPKKSNEAVKVVEPVVEVKKRKVTPRTKTAPIPTPQLVENAPIALPQQPIIQPPVEVPKKRKYERKKQFVMTEKRKENFEKVRAIRDANREKRQKDKELLKQYEKEKLEQKVLKKAVAVKKRQQKKLEVLDQVSDEEIEVSKKPTKQTKPQSQPVQNIPVRKVKPVFV